VPLQQLAQAATEATGSTAEPATGKAFEIPALAPEVLFHIGPLAVTNTILYTYLVILTLLVLVWLCRRKLQEVPAARSWQAFAEVVLSTVLNLAENSLGRERARIIFPLACSLFIFILAANWMALFPLVGPIYLVKEGGEHVPLFRAVAADWSTTIALALVTFIVTEFWGLRFRAKEHLMHFVKPPVIGQIEFISEFIRVLSLSVRLFGNLFAGEVLITMMTTLTFLIVPAVFLVLETLFGFIQAAVFTVLCLAYFTLNTTSHHQEHEETHAAVHAAE